MVMKTVRECSRRAVLAAGAAGLGAVLGAGLLPGPAAASTIPPSRLLPFTVLRGDSTMGTHTIAFQVSGDRTTVDIAIDLAVKLGPIPLFRYTHRNREVWEGGRLVAIETTTDDNGDAYAMSGRADGDLFRFQGVEGEGTAPADIIPSSYWNIAILDRRRILDTQRGILRDISVDRVGQDAIQAAGRSIVADRWRIADTLPVDLWYSEQDQFVKLAFEARGSEIDYVLEPGPAAPTLAGQG